MTYARITKHTSPAQIENINLFTDTGQYFETEIESAMGNLDAVKCDINCLQKYI